MNLEAMWGWIGGIAGDIIGLAGGIAGTYFSIKNTSGPRERSFMIKSAVVCWIAIIIFLGLLLSLPNLYRWFMWMPYSILLPLGIIFGNRRQQAKKVPSISFSTSPSVMICCGVQLKVPSSAKSQQLVTNDGTCR